MGWPVLPMAIPRSSSSHHSLPFCPPPTPPQLHSPAFASLPPRLPPLFLCSAAQRSSVELNRGIAHFYDSSSQLWEDLWGEHMHHGFYDLNLAFPASLLVDHSQAQIRMIEEALSWAGIPEEGPSTPKKILDVGCGIGGSSRLLAQKYGSAVVGITLSPKQAERATELTSSAGLGHQVTFQIADALDLPFPDNQFDLVWSMESGEHMPDKQKFVSELNRVTKPGGRILIATWCHRELLSEEKHLKPSEQVLLDKICDAYYLPHWCAMSEYLKLAQSMQLQGIKAVDWSKHVKPFWQAVIISALSWKGLLGLAKSGWTTIQGALAMLYMVQGYNIGLIKFSIITAQKQGLVNSSDTMQCHMIHAKV